MDGTILRLGSTAAELEALRHKLKTYFKSQGMDYSFKSIFKDLLEIKQKSGKSPAIINAGFKLLEAFELNGAKKAVPIKGANECLSLLKKKAIPRGLLTNNSSACTTHALCRAAINGSLFDYIITRDDICFFKPHPEPLLKFINLFSSESALEKLCFVGDHFYDVQCVRAANLCLEKKEPLIKMVSIMVNRSAEYANAAQPDFYFESLAALTDSIAHSVSWRP